MSRRFDPTYFTPYIKTRTQEEARLAGKRDCLLPAAVDVPACTRLPEPLRHVQEVCDDDYDHHMRGIEPVIAARVDSVHDFAYFCRQHAKAAVRLVIYRSSPTSSS